MPLPSISTHIHWRRGNHCYNFLHQTLVLPVHVHMKSCNMLSFVTDELCLERWQSARELSKGGKGKLLLDCTIHYSQFRAIMVNFTHPRLCSPMKFWLWPLDYLDMKINSQNRVPCDFLFPPFLAHTNLLPLEPWCDNLESNCLSATLFKCQLLEVLLLYPRPSAPNSSWLNHLAMNTLITAPGSQFHDSLYPPNAFRYESVTKYFLTLSTVSKEA